jgi:hypothetical protein
MLKRQSKSPAFELKSIRINYSEHVVSQAAPPHPPHIFHVLAHFGEKVPQKVPQ